MKQRPYLVKTTAAILMSLAIPATSLPLAASEQLPTPPEVWAKYDPDAGDFKEEIVKEETKDGKKESGKGLTAAQKKLPEGLRKAIEKKKK